MRIRQLEAPIYLRFDEPEKIIGLRNLLIHGYDAVDSAVLWAIANGNLPALNTLLDDLLKEAREQGL